MNHPAPSPPRSASELYVELFAPLNQGLPRRTYELVQPYLQQYPNDSELWFIAGCALKRMGDVNQSIFTFSKTLELRPDHWKALFELGEIMLINRHDDQAIGLFESVLNYQPNDIATYAHLVQLHMRNNDFERMAHYAMQLVLLNPDDTESWTLARFAFNRSIKVEIPAAFIDLISERAPKISRLDTDFVLLAVMILFHKHHQLRDMMKKVSAEGTTCLAPLSDLHGFVEAVNDPIFISLLDRSVVNQMSFENLLIAMRYAILESFPRLTDEDMEATANATPLIGKLARYFFRTEYLAEVTPAETGWISNLRQRLNEDAQNQTTPAAYHLLALQLFACYGRLSDLESMPYWKVALSENDSMPASLAEIVRVTYDDIMEERAIAVTIKTHGSLRDKVSLRVQGQYEENPYPRWDVLGERPSFTARDYFSNIFTVPVLFPLSIPDHPRVLVAGCGTGMQPLITSQILPDATLLNVDLSRASLAYAIRKTRELGYEKQNEFMQADLLELGTLNEQFDMIECSGVLHHMGDPMAGWRVLTELLKPGGLMKIGLYSQLARRSITRAREEISAGGYDETLEGMRRYRKHAVQDPANTFALSSDFYTASSLRDLLFHRQEHQFTIPQLKASLETLGLRFVCFLFDRITYDKFNDVHSGNTDYGNLDLWQQVEEAEPSLFFGMYQFWCYKPVR